MLSGGCCTLEWMENWPRSAISHNLSTRWETFVFLIDTFPNRSNGKFQSSPAETPQYLFKCICSCICSTVSTFTFWNPSVSHMGLLHNVDYLYKRQISTFWRWISIHQSHKPSKYEQGKSKPFVHNTFFPFHINLSRKCWQTDAVPFPSKW